MLASARETAIRSLPIVAVIVVWAVLTFILTDNTRYLAVLPQKVFSQISIFSLLAMPLFILAGELMNRGGVTKSLIDLSMALIGRLRGGLGKALCGLSRVCRRPLRCRARRRVESERVEPRLRRARRRLHQAVRDPTSSPNASVLR